MAGQPINPALTTRGRNTNVCLALMRSGETAFPVMESLVLAGTDPIAKGSTTLTLTTATVNAFAKGQGFQFVDANEMQFYAVLAAATEAGVTELTIEPLGEAIPAGSAAPFPVRSLLRTSADLSESVETEEIDTFDHKSTAYLRTGKNGEFSMEGLYSAFDPGRACIHAAKDQGLRIYVQRTLDAPSDKYVSGEREEFFAIVTSAETPSPVDGPVAFNASCQVDGEITRSAPVAIA